MSGRPGSLERRAVPAGSAVEWVTSAERFAALAPAWDELAERSGNPFLLYGWLASWWEAFGAGRELAIVTIWDGERIASALPLASGPAGALVGLANGHAPDFDALYCDDAGLAAALSAAGSRTSQLVLPVVHDRRVVEAARARPSRLVAVEAQPPMMSVRVDGPFSDYMRASSWRRTLDRSRRKLHREHEVAVAVLAPPTDLDAELTRGFELEASGWKRAAGTAILSHPATERFYREVAAHFAGRGELRTSSLVVDGRLAAWHLQLLHGGRVHGLKSAYDEELSSLRPGNVSLLAILEGCFELGLDAYELGPANEDYKTRFANEQVPAVTIRSYRPGPRTAVRYAYRRAVRPRLRTVKRELLARRRALSARTGRSRRPGRRGRSAG